MAKEVFNWKVQVGMTSEFNSDVNVIKFGDGYEQRSPKGLNSVYKTFNVLVRLDKRTQLSEISRLKAFLKTHFMVKTFRWRPPNEDEIMVVCDSSSLTDNGVYIDFELTFRQVFN